MWKILDALGMEKKQMYQILIFEACACYLIASITGMGLGTLTYLAAMKGWEKILGYPLAAKVTGKAYAGTLLYSFFVFSFSYFFSCMKLNKFRIRWMYIFFGRCAQNCINPHLLRLHFFFSMIGNR